jgi:hypothetical protein
MPLTSFATVTLRRTETQNAAKAAPADAAPADAAPTRAPAVPTSQRLLTHRATVRPSIHRTELWRKRLMHTNFAADQRQQSGETLQRQSRPDPVSTHRAPKPSRMFQTHPVSDRLVAPSTTRLLKMRASRPDLVQRNRSNGKAPVTMEQLRARNYMAPMRQQVILRGPEQ